MLEKFGYNSEDVYEKIRQEIKRSNLFRFNWFIKSRTTAEISKRCQMIVAAIAREMDPSGSYFANPKAGITAAATVMMDDEPKARKTKSKSTRKAAQANA